MQYPVLVTGVGGPAGRATASFFRQKGFRVIGTDPSYRKSLLDLIDQERPILVVPTLSEVISTVSLCWQEINSLATMVFISHPDAVEIMDDKYYTGVRLRDLGIATPRTVPRIVRKKLAGSGTPSRVPFSRKAANGQARSEVLPLEGGPERQFNK